MTNRFHCLDNMDTSQNIDYLLFTDSGMLVIRHLKQHDVFSALDSLAIKHT